MNRFRCSSCGEDIGAREMALGICRFCNEDKNLTYDSEDYEKRIHNLSNKLKRELVDEDERWIKFCKDDLKIYEREKKILTDEFTKNIAKLRGKIPEMRIESERKKKILQIHKKYEMYAIVCLLLTFAIVLFDKSFGSDWFDNSINWLYNVIYAVPFLVMLLFCHLSDGPKRQLWVEAGYNIVSLRGGRCDDTKKKWKKIEDDILHWEEKVREEEETMKKNYDASIAEQNEEADEENRQIEQAKQRIAICRKYLDNRQRQED